MNPLLISGFGTTIKVDKRKLIIDNHKSGINYEFLPHQISYDSIIIDGHTGNISFEAIRWLTKHDIPITVLNWNGNLLASINPKENNNGKLRVKQYEAYTNRDRYYIASRILDEKIIKSLDLLEEMSLYYDIDIDSIKKAFEEEKKAHKLTAEMCSQHSVFNIKNLLDYEGKIAMLYWDNLRLIFNELYPDFHFENRKNKSYSWNMNASDEINALLNYGYAILESITRKCINTVGLDQSVGFLHELSPGKTPLVYDLQELYRWIVDLSVIQLLEEKKLTKKDFIVTENYHIRLRENTAKLLIEKIQGNFNRKVGYKCKNYTYETIYQENTQKLANFLTGKNRELYFEIPGIKYERNDDKELRAKLLEISLADAKKLGLTKSTLWYIQKNIREGKKIELYEKVKDKIKV
jgi:CRISPR-associated protein Cas1